MFFFILCPLQVVNNFRVESVRVLEHSALERTIIFKVNTYSSQFYLFIFLKSLIQYLIV